MFGNMTVGKKIVLGFAATLAAMVCIMALSFTGIGGIVDNAEEAIGGNRLDRALARMEVDHLVWANKVNALLTDEKITHLDVQSDDHQCDLGKWLYGDGRKKAEALVPSLASALEEVETPHAQLHASAIEIRKHFHQADGRLPKFLVEKEVDHLRWIGKCNDLFLRNRRQLEVTVDPHQCGLGRFLYGEAGMKAGASDPELTRLLEAVKAPHSRLHASAVKIRTVWRPRHPGLIAALRQRLDDHRRWAMSVADSLRKNQPVRVETDPTQCAFGRWLGSEECKRYSAEWREFATIIARVTNHHTSLHDSAVEIVRDWKEVHPGLLETLKDRLDDHRAWGASIANSLLASQPIQVETDPSRCAFGKWLGGESCRKLRGRWPEFATIVSRITTHHNALHASAVRIARHCNEAHPGLAAALKGHLEDHRRWVGSAQRATKSGQVVTVETDPAACALGRWLAGPGRKKVCADWPAFDVTIDSISKQHDELHATMHRIVKASGVSARQKIYREQTAVALDILGKVIGQAISQAQAKSAGFDRARGTYRTSMIGELDALGRNVAGAVALEEANVAGAERARGTYQTRALTELNRLAGCFEKVIRLEQENEAAGEKAHRIFATETAAAWKDTQGGLKLLADRATAALDETDQARSIYATRTLPALHKVRQLLSGLRGQLRDSVVTHEGLLDTARDTRRNVGIAGAAGIVVCIVLAFLIATGIVKALRRLTEGLSAGTEQTASAAGQISGASQSLAQGANEQASSVEETTSGVEEMTSMIKQNAGNADQARDLSAGARNAADRGTEAMGRMSRAIDEIKKSSDETARIVHTIDEIAFQTNLLALNAAVEAARAGEAGKGFAVVAEEVRNLAQRSAEAARNTADMIEGSVKNADNGVQISQQVGQALQEIAEGNRKVNDLVAEIATASGEQAQGIDQINQAVGQVDQITQSNAANAQQSASAGQELSAQAEGLNNMVAELRVLVGGHDVDVTPGRLTFRPDTTAEGDAQHQVETCGAAIGQSQPEQIAATGDDRKLPSF